MAAIRRIVCSCVLFAFPVLTSVSDRVLAQTQAPAIQWEPTLTDALAKARTAGKPLLVAFVMDDEPANDTVANDYFKDPEVVRLSAKMVCVIGNLGAHSTGTCSKFGCVTCDQHQAAEKQARATWLKTDVVRAPQFVFCDRNGIELFRKVYLLPKQELRRSMEMAMSEASPEPGSELAAERARVDRWLRDADSRNAETRDAAFAMLATANDPRAIPALLDKARPSNDDTTRCAAIRALGVKGNHAAVVPLTAFLGDKNTRVCLCALIALAEIDLPDPAPAILTLLRREKNNRIRGRGLRTAAKIHHESLEVRKQCLQALAGGSAQLREAALLALFELDPDPAIVAAVRPFLTAKTEGARALAVWILGRQQDPSLAAAIEKVAEADKSPDVRAIARKALTVCSGGEVKNYDTACSQFVATSDL